MIKTKIINKKRVMINKYGKILGSTQEVLQNKSYRSGGIKRVSGQPKEVEGKEREDTKK